MKLFDRQFTKPLVIIVFIAIALVVVFTSFLAIYDTWYFDNLSREEDRDMGYGDCNIAIIPIVDELTSLDAGTWEDYEFEDIGMTSADRVVARIREVAVNDGIDGVILQIDSGGGAPVASEMIMNELKRFSKPSVGLIREYGASGAYLAATGADVIIASGYSDVGGIGINMSYLENSKLNSREGINYVQLTSAKYKDYGSPDRPMTAEERRLVEQDLDTYHSLFVDKVAQNRNLSIADVEKLADGSTLPGEMALQVGLIDQIGDEQTAREWFAKQLDLSINEVVTCN